MIPPLGMIDVPYWEWWLHHHPFRRQQYSCPICASDTGCFAGCPAREIYDKLSEVKALMEEYTKKLIEKYARKS